MSIKPLLEETGRGAVALGIIEALLFYFALALVGFLYMSNFLSLVPAVLLFGLIAGMFLTLATLQFWSLTRKQ